MKLKENGITLIELLATITILSIVGLLVWGVFFQGLQFSSKAVSINQMQQEANLVTAYLTRIHQTSESYTIENEDETITVEAIPLKAPTTPTIQRFNNELLRYEVTTDKSGEINPNEDDVIISITIRDKKSEQNHVKVETVLTRLKNKGGINP